MAKRAEVFDFPEHCFPPVAHPRRIFVRGLEPETKDRLESRGYVVVELATLPRQSTDETVTYLLSKAQAIEERTIETSAEERKCLELEMRAYGLLDKRSLALSLDVSADASELDSLLGWGSSRHTLAGNSTVVSAQMPGRRGRKRRMKVDD